MEPAKLADYVGKVSSGAISTYVYMLSLASGGELIITMRKLAELTGRSRSSVLQHIDELEKAGMISVEKRQNEDGGKTSNRYKMLV